MSAVVLGISGSPIPNSNTDRAVQAALAATAQPCEFIKLSTLSIEPCRACLGCVNSNACVVADDGQKLAEKFRQAKGFILGAFTPYSSLDARTKTFIERMYCLRHLTGLNQGKIGAAIITTACEAGNPRMPPAAETAAAQIGFWMMEEGMVNVGHVVLPGNVPCVRCGYGDACALSGVKLLHGAEATIEDIGIKTFEEQVEIVAAATELGRRVGQALLEAEADAASRRTG